MAERDYQKPLTGQITKVFDAQGSGSRRFQAFYLVHDDAPEGERFVTFNRKVFPDLDEVKDWVKRTGPSATATLTEWYIQEYAPGKFGKTVNKMEIETEQGDGEDAQEEGAKTAPSKAPGMADHALGMMRGGIVKAVGPVMAAFIRNGRYGEQDGEFETMIQEMVQICGRLEFYCKYGAGPTAWDEPSSDEVLDNLQGRLEGANMVDEHQDDVPF